MLWVQTVQQTQYKIQVLYHLLSEQETLSLAKSMSYFLLLLISTRKHIISWDKKEFRKLIGEKKKSPEHLRAKTASEKGYLMTFFSQFYQKRNPPQLF